MGGTPDRGGRPGTELPFAGRDGELRDFDADLTEATSGRCRLIVVTGAHGTGKSRLVDEFAAAARRRSFTIVSARGVDQTGSPPMWCWRHLVTGLLDGLDPLSRASVVGAHGPALGGLVLPVASESDGTDRDSPAAMFRLMEAVSLTLRDAARRRPVLVTVDDAQWTDASSLRTLAFAASLLRDAALVIVVVFAPWTDDVSAKRVGAVLSEVVRQPIARVVEIGGLSAGSVDALVAARRGSSNPTLSARILEATDGNAFLVTQLLNGAAGDGDESPEAFVPRSVLAVLEARLQAANTATWRTVQVASVIGREFSIDVVAAVEGCSVAAIDGALTFAAQAGVVEDVDRSRRRFVHSLFHDATYATLTIQERADLHASIAAVLAARAQTNETRELARIASHLAAAAKVQPDLVPRAVSAALAAADDAADQLAWDEAAVLLDGAADLLDRHPERADRSVADVLARLGDAQRRAGRPELAMTTYAAAGERCRDDPRLLTLIALGHEDSYLSTGIARRTSGDPSIELLERARSKVGATDPSSVALAAAVARAYWFSGFGDRARELLADIASSNVDADDATAMRVLDLRRLVAGDPASTAPRLQVIDELFAVAERAGRFEVALDALRARILTSVELARLDDADDDIDRFARLVQRWREPHFRPFVPILRTMRALQEGRFADAATQIGRSQLEAVAGAATPHQLILMQRYALARWWERAPFAPLELVPELHQYTGRTGSAPAWRHALAQLHVEAGDCGSATDLIATDRQRGEHWLRLLPFDEFWSLSMGFLANALAAIGTDTERQDALQRLTPHCGLLVGNVAPLTGPLDQAAGVLAQSLGRHDLALEHLRSAADVARRLNAPPWEVQALHAARSSSQQVRGDGQWSASDIDRRLAPLLGRLEMKTPDGRSDSTATPPTRPVGPGPAPPDLSALTSREREVLALLTAGHSNHEIADQLFISYRTVKTHVSHILEKLQLRDRTAAAVVGASAGLTTIRTS